MAPSVPDISCCFELLGFDVILDANLKPWILEVNSSPALSVDTELDAEVKTALINDTIDLLGLQSPAAFWATHKQGTKGRRTVRKDAPSTVVARTQPPSAPASSPFHSLIESLTLQHLSAPSNLYEQIFPRSPQVQEELLKLKKSLGTRDFSQVSHKVISFIVNTIRTDLHHST